MRRADSGARNKVVLVIKAETAAVPKLADLPRLLAQEYTLLCSGSKMDLIRKTVLTYDNVTQTTQSVKTLVKYRMGTINALGLRSHPSVLSTCVGAGCLCIPPGETHGYDVDPHSLDFDDFNATVHCQSGYAGLHPRALRCEEFGGSYGLWGCSQSAPTQPEPSSRLSWVLAGCTMLLLILVLVMLVCAWCARRTATVVISCPEMGTAQPDGQGPYDQHVMDKCRELFQSGVILLGFDRAGTSTTSSRDVGDWWRTPASVRASHWFFGCPLTPRPPR